MPDLPCRYIRPAPDLLDGANALLADRSNTPSVEIHQPGSDRVPGEFDLGVQVQLGHDVVAVALDSVGLMSSFWAI